MAPSGEVYVSRETGKWESRGRREETRRDMLGRLIAAVHIVTIGGRANWCLVDDRSRKG